MSLAAWMKPALITVKPRDSARHARELMERHRINQLPVVVDDRLVGIVTDRDLRDLFPSMFETAPALAHRTPRSVVDPTTIPVEYVMTSTVLTLPPAATVADAARLMRRERIGAIPIVERERLVGILSRSDVLDAFVELSTRSRTVSVTEARPN